MSLRAAYRAGIIAGLLAALPAHAQYYEYGSDKPQVELNLDVIGGPPAREAPKLRPPAPAPAARIEEQDIPPPPPKAARAETAPEPEVAPEPAPPPVVQEAPRKKILLKPVFTAPEPEEETAPPPPPKPRRAESRPARPVAAAPEARHAAPAPTPAPEEKKEEPARPQPEQAATPAVPLPADLTLAFTDNTSDLAPELQQKLDGITKQMNDLPDTRLQVRAYATGEDGNTSSARRISLSRALSVRSYLMDKGIKPNRVDVRALGAETDHGPLDRVDLVFVK